MKKRYAIPLTLLCVTALAAGTTYAFLPWRDFAGRQLQRVLQDKGFDNVRLTVASAGLTGATLRDITIGADNPLTLRDLSLHYDIRELWDGNLRDLALDDLAVTVRQDQGRWLLQGFAPRESAAPFAFPDSAAAAHARVPFDTVKATNTNLAVAAEAWRTTMTLDAEWARTPHPRLTAATDAITFENDALAITSAKAETTVTLPAGTPEWTGTWSVRDIRVKGNDMVPPLDAAGTLRAAATTLTIDGTLQSADGKTTAAFKMAQDLSNGAKSRLTVTSARMPWKSGTLGVRNVNIPLRGDAPIHLDLRVDNVSVDELMQAMTGKRVTATGAVSGTLPVTIGRDGTITPGKGALAAAEPGTITMPPDAIPGDNPQIALTRDILKHFNYSLLSITTEAGQDGRPAILLTLEGNNPDVQGGRAVKLNVRLTGDVLDFIQQNIMLLSSPEKLLQQDNP